MSNLMARQIDEGLYKSMFDLLKLQFHSCIFIFPFHYVTEVKFQG